MKIVILGTAHPYRGGIAALNERLAQELVKEGNDVTIYNFSLQYPGFLFPGKTQYTTDAPPRELKILSKINSINPFNWLKVGKELKKNRPDLIIVRYWLPFMGPALGKICRIAKKNKHTKVICIADNIIPHEKRIGDYALTKYFTHSVDGFITLSKQVYNDLETFVKNPIRRYTPHPLYDHYGEIISRKEALKKLGLDEKYHYLLFFGFIRDYKGLDLLLETMAKPAIKKQNIKLIVAGEFYSDKEKYVKIIEDFSISENVILKSDYIPNDDVNLYFCASDMIVQPYKSATQSGVTQIGYHFNKPMLVTKVGGLPEIVFNGKSGYVVETTSTAIA
ncbi:MAG: glycosyltransferase, partial [Odoribacter sp.]|nr:glycosyltransferase [Odoribacter sp.]